MKASMLVAAFGVTFGAATAASAQLVITEIWQGVSGPDHTGDWFELTNFGQSAFDPTTLFFEDESADPVEAAQLMGITSIASGESVIFVGGDMSDASLFELVWNTGGNVQVGWHDGSGLGQSGDAIFLFDSTLPGANTVASQAFGETSDGQSWFWNPVTMSWNNELSVAGQFGAYESSFGPDTTFPAVGSPGVIPAPGAASLFAIGAAGLLRRRRA